jgi:DNA invertase Pin-like site-specific DNA recombinase
VSTRDQNPDGQRDALTAAGCHEVLVDKASGKLARRPALDKALLMACSGDQLVITKLDRLGRSQEHLITLSRDLQARGVDLVVLDQGIDTSTAVGRMFFQIIGSIAEFEHALMSERTHDDLAATQVRGPTGGLGEVGNDSVGGALSDVESNGEISQAAWRGHERCTAALRRRPSLR